MAMEPVLLWSSFGVLGALELGESVTAGMFGRTRSGESDGRIDGLEEPVSGVS
jgi:hypothetical protein